MEVRLSEARVFGYRRLRDDFETDPHNRTKPVVSAEEKLDFQDAALSVLGTSLGEANHRFIVCPIRV
jgi:hypothetical protein